MSIFNSVSKLTHQERDLVVFDNHFREILCQLTLMESRPDRLEAVKDLLNDKTFQNSVSQTSEFDLAQAILLVVNRIKIKSDKSDD
tara:strand:- start:10908 stop:11165 length:258 start_codon:yes stop_codon:yes gene_type:complete